MSRLTRDGTAKPLSSRETKFSGANEGREVLIFPVELTTSSIGNLTRSIHTVVYDDHTHTYINTYCLEGEQQG